MTRLLLVSSLFVSLFLALLLPQFTYAWSGDIRSSDYGMNECVYNSLLANTPFPIDENTPLIIGEQAGEMRVFYLQSPGVITFYNNGSENYYNTQAPDSAEYYYAYNQLPLNPGDDSACDGVSGPSYFGPETAAIDYYDFTKIQYVQNVNYDSSFIEPEFNTVKWGYTPPTPPENPELTPGQWTGVIVSILFGWGIVYLIYKSYTPGD